MARRRLEEAAGPDRVLGRPAARDVADEHFVYDDRQAVHVGALVQIGQTRGLLRTHVAGRPDGEARPSQVRAAGGADRLGDTEVRDDRMSLREQDVLRFDVAVQHTHAMRVRQRIRHRLGDRQGLLLRERAAGWPLELLAQRAAVDVRHDVIEEAARLSRIVQRQDVRVLQPRGNLNLFQETLSAQEGRQAREQHFECDGAVVLLVVGEVHRRHPAASQDAPQRVAVGERGLEFGGNLHAMQLRPLWLPRGGRRTHLPSAP